jgi:hypothetical protein
MKEPFAPTAKKRQTETVENALFRRAIGYETEDVTLDESDQVVKTVRKQVAPCIQAALAWLRVYRPETWGKASAGDFNGSADDTATLYLALQGGE